MKMIEAIIRKERIEPVKNALEGIGVLGMTVTQVSGRGRQKGIALQWRAGEYRVDLLPKAKLEIVIDDEQCDPAVEAICKAAKTGKEGDGMIFVLPVGNVYRVRTNDNAETCLAK
jgi:nitrogen regulatory protein P-II 1